ncbi:MAG: GGDEF domain-containing protein [Thermodesulfobacteriota bacterium]
MVPHKPASDRQLQQLLDAVQTGLLHCDQGYRAVFTNRTAEAILGRPALAATGQSCHQLLFGSQSPCEGCPAGLPEGAAPRRHSLSLNRPEGDIYLRVFCHPWQDHYLLTLHDVTQEITLLRQSHLDRKEFHAKNILLERRRRLNAEEQECLAQLMDSLPDAMVTVDAHFAVQRSNSAAGTMLAGGEHRHCYAIFGHSQPCPACPAASGFARADGYKKSQTLAGRVFTEIFSVAPNGQGGLLLFRDITRQFDLISQIRSHQEEIARKNKLLSLLVDFGTCLQKGSDVQEVVDYFLDTVLPSLHQGAAALFVQDLRAGNLWLAEQRHMAADEFKALTRACLSRGAQTQKADECIAEGLLPWRQSRQVPLVGAKGQRVGLVLLEGEMGEETLGFLRLVTEPLGAYFQNQLLYRQLEEKANKDALTGLFNRGYLTMALGEERQKYKQYGIHHAVVVADINGLKRLNDQHGHECGDQLIVAVARAMQQSLRVTDVAARTGGDEFVLLLTNTTDEEAGHFVDRLQQEIFAALSIPLPDGTAFAVTVSIGRAGSDRHPVESLLAEADRRMYSAKEAFYKAGDGRR